MNPCPCGYAGTPQCTCDAKSIEKYQKKLSGPLLDRIDLQVPVLPLSLDERFAPVADDESSKMRALVEKARQRQQQRFTGTDIPHNAAIPGGMVQDHCQFSAAGFTAFKDAISRGHVSTRTTDRLAKVSRTIADLDGSETLESKHIDEATRYVAGGVLQSDREVA
jgi:magnesium chelatase family protein